MESSDKMWSTGEGNGKPLLILAWKIPWTEELVGYSPWGHKESDRTEGLHFHPLLDKDNMLMEASGWERLTEKKSRFCPGRQGHAQ